MHPNISLDWGPRDLFCFTDLSHSGQIESRATLAGAPCRAHASAGAWRVSDSHASCGDRFFWAFVDGNFVDDNNDELDVMELSDAFPQIGFQTISHAIAPVSRKTGETQTADPKARVR